MERCGFPGPIQCSRQLSTPRVVHTSLISSDTKYRKEATDISARDH
jgi:hypothetical protein